MIRLQDYDDMPIRVYRGNAKEKSILSAWPVRRTPNWLDYVNEPQTELELAAIRRNVKRGFPLGEQGWTSKIIERLGLEGTIRPHGRPKNGS